MKQMVLVLMCACFSAGLFAQAEEQQQVAKFKPRYAGTSVNTGFTWMPNFGSAFYVAPKLQFQATPRLFVNTGISVVQYNLLPSQMKYEGFSPQRTAVGTYIFAEGMYLLNERWSVNGSVMKDVSPEPLRRATPFRMPSQAAHFGVDYKITPNITVGARVGYSNGGRSNSPFYPY
jgi:opacity protein-like surface antigen